MMRNRREGRKAREKGGVKGDRDRRERKGRIDSMGGKSRNR